MLQLTAPARPPARLLLEPSYSIRPTPSSEPDCSAFGGFAPAHPPASRTLPPTRLASNSPPPPDDTGYAAGNLFFLTSGPSGPVRGAGFEYQQIYNVTDGGLYIHPSYNSGRSLGAKYSPCPREWQFALWGDFDNKGTVVPF